MPRLSKLAICYFLFWAVYFSYFWSNAIFYDETGGVTVSHVGIWGDWAAHFTMGSHMAYQELLPKQSPFLLGAPFSYPFVANLISAVLIRLGVPFFSAFTIPSYVFSLLLVAALYYFYKTLFRSETIAVLACFLFLFNGGIGFVQFIFDVLHSTDPIGTLLNPPFEYTHLPTYYLEWISVIYSMVVPQRAFTLGFPIALVLLAGFYRAFLSGKPQPIAVPGIIALGVGLGLLPILHSHSFLALAVILPIWSMAFLLDKQNQQLKKLQPLLAVGVLAALIAGPLYLIFLAQNASNQSFFTWKPGWYANPAEYDISWLGFWFNNWSMTPVMAGLGWVWAVKSRWHGYEQSKIVLLFAPFFLLFVLINLFLFQPFIWDNTKLLTWASVGMSGLAAFALVELWKRLVQRRHSAKLQVLKPAAALIIILAGVSMMAAGAIDALRVIRFNLHQYQMYTQEELELAEWVKTNTPADSIWLTGDKHNHWLYNLTGRQPVFVFRGWLWTHGYEYANVERDVASLFKNPNQPEVWQHYGIDYVVVGSHELMEWQANEPQLRTQFPVVKETREYVIFQVTTPAQAAELRQEAE